MNLHASNTSAKFLISAKNTMNDSAVQIITLRDFKLAFITSLFHGVKRCCLTDVIVEKINILFISFSSSLEEFSIEPEMLFFCSLYVDSFFYFYFFMR